MDLLARTKDGERVRGSGAEGDGDASQDVVFRGFGHLARVRRSPQEEAINAANTELQGGNGQGEPGRAAWWVAGFQISHVQRGTIVSASSSAGNNAPRPRCSSII